MNTEKLRDIAIIYSSSLVSLFVVSMLVERLYLMITRSKQTKKIEDLLSDKAFQLAAEKHFKDELPSA